MPPVSKIAKLPPEIRAQLERWLIDNGFGDIVEVTERLNALLAERGESLRVGKSAVGVESQRLRRAREAIAASTRAMQIIAETSRDDADMRGEALTAQLSTGMFEAVLDFQQAADEEDPGERIKLFTKASLGAARLSSASVNQRKWRAEVEDKARAAADAVTKIARTGGLNAAQVREIRSQILGITRRSPEPAPDTNPAPEPAGAAAPAAAG